jgi:glycosyltransferase involved in cell wall biosynthesis
MKISIIVPVYNEAATLQRVLDRVLALPLDKEVVVVDDGSTDASSEILAGLRDRPGLEVVTLPHNRGKGNAIRAALERVSGDIVYIQDADEEIDPAVCAELAAPIENGEARAVYGRRTGAGGTALFPSLVARRLISLVFNALYGQKLADPTTGCKAVETELLRSLNLSGCGFEVEQEMSARIARQAVPIREVPVEYHPRTFAEGKKIRWRDGARAVWTLLKHRLDG